jgi:DNA-binding NtrC family response regulator
MKKKCILLVDDEESICVGFQFQLEIDGYDVDIAQSGEEAIELLEMNSSYDLVITDLRMHGVSGVDVFKKVGELNVNIPVLIITGFSAQSELLKEAMELKPCGHLFKPFTKEEFLKKVRLCIEGA